MHVNSSGVPHAGAAARQAARPPRTAPLPLTTPVLRTAPLPGTAVVPPTTSLPSTAPVPRGALTRQLLRGALGFGAIGAGLALSVAVGPAALLLLPVGLLALRGCPACWLAGLLSIVGGRRGHLECTDGGCVRAERPTSTPIPKS